MTSVPEITDPADAEAETELAVLSAVAHGKGPNGLTVVQAALVAVGRLDQAHAMVYFQLIWNGLREPMRQALGAWVMERQTEDEATFPQAAATVECIVPKRVEELQMFEYSPAWPHGRLRIAFPEIFFVIGTNKTQHDGVGIQTSRTMVVVREDGALTLLNTVRLTEEGLRDLEGLGEVRNVVRLGAFHGRDDPFYRDRYGATLWTLPGAAPLDGRGPDRELASGGAFPVRTGEVFVFSSARFPEAAVLLHHEGGILITCDAVQNWTHIDEFFSPQCGELFAEQGLIRAANIPSTWRAACHPGVDDFRRLLALPFRHLISAHGEPLRDEAHALLQARTDEVFSA